MSNITLQLDTDALREATAQAILGVITPEAKEKLFADAVRAILTPSTDSWRQGKSPLQTAFETATINIAQEEAIKLVGENSEIRARMQELLRSTADKVLNADSNEMAKRMAEAFVASMRKDY